MKLSIGTVNFGLKYGINSQQLSTEESLDCLSLAFNHGINSIDTASSYGCSEELVAMFIRLNNVKRKNIFITSKIARTNQFQLRDFENFLYTELQKTLEKLNTDYIDTYLFHDNELANNVEKLSLLKRLKKDNLVKNVGISVYTVQEAIDSINSKCIDVIQIPASIFDTRMKKAGVFELAFANNVKVDIRSIFLQGLVLRDSKMVPDYLYKARPLLNKFENFCKKNNISKFNLAVEYIKTLENVNNVIVGCDNKEQLKQLICAFDTNHCFNPLDFLELSEVFDDIDEEILMPNKWVK